MKHVQAFVSKPGEFRQEVVLPRQADDEWQVGVSQLGGLEVERNREQIEVSQTRRLPKREHLRDAPSSQYHQPFPARSTKS